MPYSLALQVNVEGAIKHLHLHRYSVRAPGFKVYIYKNNTYTEMLPTPEVRTFRGTIEENPNAVVFGCITTILIKDRNGCLKGRGLHS